MYSGLFQREQREKIARSKRQNEQNFFRVKDGQAPVVFINGLRLSDEDAIDHYLRYHPEDPVSKEIKKSFPNLNENQS